MKGKIIKVDIFENSNTLYICYGVDTEDICYFMCLEEVCPASKYIMIKKDDLKDSKNKKNNYKDSYTCDCHLEEHYEMIRVIRDEL